MTAIPSRSEIAAVYAAAVIQGIVLVTFPAVSAIFTSKEHYGLSTTEYGGMFAPQAVTAILASLLGAGLTRRIGLKRVFLIGLAADLLSMALLCVSQFATSDHALAYGLLLAATACLGIAFGFVVPAVNTFTAAFFPQKVDQSILTLNALLGTGTALAPIFAAIFVGLGVWWGLPVLMAALTLALLLFSLRLPLNEGRTPSVAKNEPIRERTIPASSVTPVNRVEEYYKETTASPVQPGPPPTKSGTLSEFQVPVNRVEAQFQASASAAAPQNPSTTKKSAGGIPARFWLYAAFALLYGICETMSGNWATVYMSTSLGASATLASLALTVFWVTVTAGRVLFAAIERWIPERWTYRALPLLLAWAAWTISVIHASNAVNGVLAFGLAGLGCSALLPLVISFGQAELTSMSASVAGGLIGFYQMGYGLAAFGVGPLQTWAGLSLPAIYRGSALVALALAALAFVIAGRAKPPRPG